MSRLRSALLVFVFAAVVLLWYVAVAAVSVVFAVYKVLQLMRALLQDLVRVFRG